MDLVDLIGSPTRPLPTPNGDGLRLQRQRQLKSEPSRIPATPSRNLTTLSESENNARTMAPPSVNGRKHKPSGLPGPPTKQPRISAPVASGIRPVGASVKVLAAPGFRNISSNSSGLSRVPSISSRSVSGSSNASLNGVGTRSTSFQSSTRSQSATTYKRPESSLTSAHQSGTAIDLVAIGEEERLGKPDGTRSTSNSPPPLSCYRKQCRYQNPRGDQISSSVGDLATHPQMQHPFSAAVSHRTMSITTGLQQLSLQCSGSVSGERRQRMPSFAKCPDTVIHIPKITPSTSETPQKLSTSPSKIARKSLSPMKSNLQTPFLSKYSNVQAAWATKTRIDDHVDYFLGEVKQMNERHAEYKSSFQEQVEMYKTRITELELIRSNLSATNNTMLTELDDLRAKLCSATIEYDNARRTHTIELDDVNRKFRNELEDVKEGNRRENDVSRKEAREELENVLRVNRDSFGEMERRLKAEIEEERARRIRETQDLSTQWALQRQKDEINTGNQNREVECARNELRQITADVEQERTHNATLKGQLSDKSTMVANLESSMQDMLAKIKFLESNSQAQSQAFAEMNQRMQDAINTAVETNAKLRTEETLRRKLHNQVQELKGNIRVFCRVRPALDAVSDETARITIPDRDEESKELLVMGPEQKSALGNVTSTKNGFSFDRVFGPSSANLEIFDEISQLVQSALDGYNVCIFCYGQTGSGKTHTMSSEDGMIPLAVHQIYNTATNLAEKGWKYSMEGSFVEVYNENLNDLLGKADDLDKKKLEIRHDMVRGKTTVTDLTVIHLDTPERVTSLLHRAASNRSVAATKANERSSRSHSVFILRLTGENSITGERSEGTLNLVDLAGSERLSHSGATGERLKETQNINRSLSCLGDVIGALGQGKDGGHVPYRNSKLTYLLQHSLGGNSKTLMFVMISPLQAHLNETLTSLKFATKVHNTHIGTAKRQSKVRELAG